MSTKLAVLKNSRNKIKIDVLRFYGGEKNGVCMQLTADTGYVQINKKNLDEINKLWKKNCE
jgi:hypothetical protein